MRLISKRVVDHIINLLNKEIDEVVNEAKNLNISWNKLPEKKECKCYAIDGSQGRKRLSGTIIYSISAYAFGNGKDRYLSHTNAFLYNYAISDQIIRLQMETLENKLAFLVGDDNYIIFMDGTLTGALTRPPVYPECIKGINTIKYCLGEKVLKDLINKFIEDLEDHYKNLKEKIENNRMIREETILADNILEEFEEFYKELEGKSIDDFIDDGFINKKALSYEEAKETIHVVLNYIEYLYSLDKLLEKNLVYVAKSFYTKRLGKKLDVLLLENYILNKYSREIPGYYIYGYDKVSHRIPKVIRDCFKNINKYVNSGVSTAYLRTLEGGFIFSVQSNLDIDEDLIAKILYHESSGYIVPLKKAHEGVKIEKKRFDTEIEALINYLKKNNLRPYIKYGRYLLE
ncbi:DNA double-strand break repair nuclease NurA [Methanocaldococcus sp.]